MPTMKPTKSEKALAKKIQQLQADSSGERNLYPIIRDLMVNVSFGIGLRPDQVVVDSAMVGGRDIPDLTVFSTIHGKPIKTPDHAYAVVEVKRGSELNGSWKGIHAEKKKYVTAGTRWFYLLDQERVYKWETPQSDTPEIFDWDTLTEENEFLKCFGVLRPDRVALEQQLVEFREGKTAFAYQSIAELGKHQFTETIRDIAGILGSAVAKLVETKVIPDLTVAKSLVSAMEKDWGAAVFDWDSLGFPIEFANIADENVAATLSAEDISIYPEAHDRFAIEIDRYLYALRIEMHLLGEYAARMGMASDISLLKPRKTKNKFTDSGKAVESFIYETASLVMSRMLMIRFSEDHGFLKRYISNGGVEVFVRYADYYSKPMQALLKETYKQSAELYRTLFDQNILDWILESNDTQVSDALLHAMYLLSRWNFKEIHGDILSGVYDHYLEVGKRRALGEVFTRPEIARYMLEKCEYNSTKTVLDPACGTGTFLVEALNQDVSRLRSAGMLTEQTVTKTLRRLFGLDISSFSVSLAQIQLLWHNMDLFAGKTPAEIRELASLLVPAIQVQGGHSSLDTLGVPLIGGANTKAAQAGLQFLTVSTEQRRKRVARVSRRFRQVVQGTYDIVIGNPPYVRPHRSTLDAQTLEAYDEVAHGQFDLYIPFLYRAMRGWVKPNGRIAFIVPMGVLEASYASALRGVMNEFKLLEIVDMEALRKKTFRGIKRPTIIFVLENSPGSADDSVTMTTLSMTSYVTSSDTIDFSSASRSIVPRRDLSENAYLPPLADSQLWMTDVTTEATPAILPKVSASDTSVLKKLAAAPRLGSIVAVVYKQRGQRLVGTAQANAVREIPENSKASDWEPYLMLAYGIKLGGSEALAETGIPIYKGQNIFPSGILGEPMGNWNVKTSKVDSLRLYAYRHLFDHSKLYAIRNVSQLPSACPAPEAVVFQNTAQLVQLSEDFPLHIYLLCRIPQWFAAKVLRTSIIEDLFTTWVKRNLVLIPIPYKREPEDILRLKQAGEQLLTSDKNLANAHRHVDDLIAGAEKKTLFELFAENDLIVAGADLTGAGAGANVTSIHEVGEYLESNELFFRIKIPNDDLRRYVAYQLDRLIEGEDIVLNVELLGAIQIPAELGEVVTAIRLVQEKNEAEAFEEAQLKLDAIVAELFGLSDQDLAYVTSEMLTDGFLKQLRPNYEHRGIRVQPYADHSQDDRYA
ncbi:MAG: SAM-dependent DNA methyltransferase [Acidobacteria bacterium]|nr:SAM-dependent DNA methyltransferase [Acidobacteriota bacterium]